MDLDNIDFSVTETQKKFKEALTKNVKQMKKEFEEFKSSNNAPLPSDVLIKRAEEAIELALMLNSFFLTIFEELCERIKK